MTINIDFKFKKLRKALSKKTALLLVLTIVVHIAIVSVNSDTFKHHRAAFKASRKYHQQQVDDLRYQAAVEALAAKDAISY